MPAWGGEHHVRARGRAEDGQLAGRSGPAIEAEWTVVGTAQRRYAKWVRLYETDPAVVIKLLDETDGRRDPLAGSPVPARFVADFDNLVLSHADRSRILGEVDPGQVMTANGIVRGTVLVDGFVGGTWKFERRRGEAAVLVEPFGRLGIADREALEAEGSRLLAATDPQASAHAVRFTGS
ncbi:MULTISPECIES: DNA glycosylase AlkZ-like family protein [Streptomyces violaceusniger group]|nr:MULTISPECIES: crosslink repair DNA glycosylase YcaQ family protein [Streptomyces violaceusniger group]